MEPEGSLPHLQVPATCPHPIVLLSLFLRLSFPSHLVSTGFPTKPLYTPPLFPIRTTCPSVLILLNLTTRIIFGEQCVSLSSSLCILHSSVITPLLGPNILLSILFSNAVILCFTLSEYHQRVQELFRCHKNARHNSPE